MATTLSRLVIKKVNRLTVLVRHAAEVFPDVFDLDISLVYVSASARRALVLTKDFFKQRQKLDCLAVD